MFQRRGSGKRKGSFSGGRKIDGRKLSKIHRHRNPVGRNTSMSYQAAVPGSPQMSK